MKELDCSVLSLIINMSCEFLPYILDQTLDTFLTCTVTSNFSGSLSSVLFILAIFLTMGSALSGLWFAYSHLGDSGRKLNKKKVLYYCYNNYVFAEMHF